MTRSVLLALAAAALAIAFQTPALVGADLVDELRSVRFEIVYESFREGNWDLFASRADGSHVVNLTRTRDGDELYPHVSPDGSKICFLADEGTGPAKVRNVYYMNRDGSDRTLVARNGRDPCWNGDGTKIAYLPGEFNEYTIVDYASKGLAIYDLATGKSKPHPNKEIHHLYNLCWSSDGAWFVATAHGGMGFRHAILAIEADGPRVVDLKIPGCRPDLSADGKRIAWGASDFDLCIGDIDWSGPKVTGWRKIVTSAKPIEVYHIDWSPDGKYVTFSRGPSRKKLGPAPEMIGVQAPGWDVCVASAETPNRVLQITHDGKGNKEPDWAPAEKKR